MLEFAMLLMLLITLSEPDRFSRTMYIIGVIALLALNVIKDML